jgi:hypothetical protein
MVGIGVILFILGLVGYSEKIGKYFLWGGLALIIFGGGSPAHVNGEYIPGRDCGYDQAGFQQGSDC